jgi:hypothetical protein
VHAHGSLKALLPRRALCPSAEEKKTKQTHKGFCAVDVNMAIDRKISEVIINEMKRR